MICNLVSSAISGLVSCLLPCQIITSWAIIERNKTTSNIQAAFFNPGLLVSAGEAVVMKMSN
jgi:hypothetical protein